MNPARINNANVELISKKIYPNHIIYNQYNYISIFDFQKLDNENLTLFLIKANAAPLHDRLYNSESIVRDDEVTLVIEIKYILHMISIN